MPAEDLATAIERILKVWKPECRKPLPKALLAKRPGGLSAHSEDHPKGASTDVPQMADT